MTVHKRAQTSIAHGLCDPAKVAQMWAERPGAMPAIDLRKSGLVVLDGDRHKAEADGRAGLRDLLRQAGVDASCTPCALTPHDGVHVYFQQNGQRLGNSAGKLGEGIDVRGDGGYIIAPYAAPTSGERYRAVPNTPDLIAAFAAKAIAPIPEAIVSLLAIKQQNGDGAAHENKPHENKQGGGDRERAYAAAALNNLTNELAATGKGGRNAALNTAALKMGHMIARGWISRSEVEQALIGAMKVNGAVADDGMSATLATLRSGIEAGMAEPHEDLKDRAYEQRTNENPDGAEAETAQSHEKSTKIGPIRWLDMSNWDNEPRPEREWAIQDRVPLNQAGLFSGEGGTGKSIIEMMKDVAHVTGKDWLGSLPEPGPAFYVGAEDDEREIHIRFYDIAAHYGVTFKELIDNGLKVLCKLGEDATLCAVSGKSGKVETTALYRQLYEAAGDLKPKNISIDTLSRAFAGNEIDRVQVYAFAMHMQALAVVARGSVTVLSHPSLQGIASGSGISGSTAWHGAFRFRQYLKSGPKNRDEKPDDGLRQFEFKKNQYGPIGETILLRYQRGLFLQVAKMSTLDKLADKQAADHLFLELLYKFQAQGRNVSHLKTANSYAPTMFAKDPKAKAPGIKDALADAMERLFAAKKIKAEEYGYASNPHYRIVRCDPQQEENTNGRMDGAV
jgi:RecA-family ATPase